MISKRYQIKNSKGHVTQEYLIRLGFANEAVVDFEAFAVCGYEDGDDDKPVYRERGKTSSLDITELPEDAQRVVQGSVKWDGCSDIDFFPDRGGNEHFCGKADTAYIGLLLAHIYDEAREMMGPKVVHDVDMFEGN